MNGVAAAARETEKQREAPARRRHKRVAEQSGAAHFTDLVWAHWEWDCARSEDGAEADAAKKAYDAKLAEFSREVGEVAHVYWSTQNASAVAMTVKPMRKGSLLRERDDLIRLHRVTDWVARDTPGIADVFHECDALAIRVGEILRGPSERIAMRWILCVQEHLLGYFERADPETPDEESRRSLVKGMRAELVKVEDYYRRAAAQAGRIVYVTGMLVGVALIAVLAAAVAGVLWLFGVFDAEFAQDVGVLFLCFGAGALGALVSVMYRLRPSGSFSLDVEVGRPLVRRLGAFRPFVGATFGLLVYAMLASGVLLVQTESDKEFLYFAVAAFFAGFSERWVHVVAADAEVRLRGVEEEPPPAAAPAANGKA
jgi:hypothetical protein